MMRSLTLSRTRSSTGRVGCRLSNIMTPGRRPPRPSCLSPRCEDPSKKRNNRWKANHGECGSCLLSTAPRATPSPMKRLAVHSLHARVSQETMESAGMGRAQVQGRQCWRKSLWKPIQVKCSVYSPLRMLKCAQDQGEDLQRSGHILTRKSAEQINTLCIYSSKGTRVCSKLCSRTLLASYSKS